MPGRPRATRYSSPPPLPPLPPQWDLAAGMSTAAMVIPQGMSYANLAGLPYAFGLYGAFVPCIVYAFLGSSRQLVVGPVAVTSILLGNGLEKFMPTLEVRAGRRPGVAAPRAAHCLSAAPHPAAWPATCLAACAGSQQPQDS